MNNIKELTSKVRIERLKSKFEIAKSYGSDQLTVPMPDLEALIAQLEAAQEEIDNLKVWKKIAAGRYENLQEIKSQLEKAEAALSAANEKLSKPVVLPDDGLEDCINMWPNNWRNDFDTGYNFGIWRCEQNIKAAGFTVEE
ncbi:hypothetical protein [Yersinia mollaretii]|uniref:hypothetical protein n=1 Tax=Yersinia mollaretii TaxID=33060 RepID=UPI0011A4EC31|nr:hypothetical protein [Yersinia mollaretii]